MKGQKGQSVVEFALVLPIFLLIILGVVYGGLAYADYLQYSTAVREAARDISVKDSAKRSATVAGLNSNNAATVKEYADPLTKLYKATFSVRPFKRNQDGSETVTDINSAQFVTVKAEFVLNNTNISVLPATLKAVQCTMPVEKDNVQQQNQP
ncbi:TadE family protein [Selenomonas sp. KH1T6]|uniref:TadE family protein n=1 Tax=Selenomonas sp. KH1T6 TaxID=3158784 RepID=UPI0008A7C832|nr:TadE-like protein [Selenomonas ruminantium]